MEYQEYNCRKLFRIKLVLLIDLGELPWSDHFLYLGTISHSGGGIIDVICNIKLE